MRQLSKGLPLAGGPFHIQESHRHERVTNDSLCPHTYDRYRHQCEVCRDTREISPTANIKSSLRIFRSSAQGNLVTEKPRKRGRPRKPEREALRQEDLRRKSEQRFIGAVVYGERHRARRAG